MDTSISNDTESWITSLLSANYLRNSERKKRKAVIFGCGYIAKQLISKYSKELEITNIFDNYIESSQKSPCTISKPYYDTSIHRDNIIVICSSRYDQISKQLNALGYRDPKHHINGILLVNTIGPTCISVNARFIEEYIQYNKLNDRLGMVRQAKCNILTTNERCFHVISSVEYFLPF